MSNGEISGSLGFGGSIDIFCCSRTSVEFWRFSRLKSPLFKIFSVSVANAFDKLSNPVGFIFTKVGGPVSIPDIFDE